jgi:hypothetical protein
MVEDPVAPGDIGPFHKSPTVHPVPAVKALLSYRLNPGAENCGCASVCIFATAFIHHAPSFTMVIEFATTVSELDEVDAVPVTSSGIGVLTPVNAIKIRLT